MKYGGFKELEMVVEYLSRKEAALDNQFTVYTGVWSIDISICSNI